MKELIQVIKTVKKSYIIDAFGLAKLIYYFSVHKQETQKKFLIMSATRREKGYADTTLHISDRQKSNLVQKNIKVRKEKVFKEEIIDLERAQFERKLNQEAKSLMRTLRLPKLAVRESGSAPFSPLLSRKNHLSNHDSGLAIPARSATPRRGSINDLAETLASNKTGSIIETIVSPPSQPSSPFQSRTNLDNDQQALFPQGNSSPRRGSMNDISRINKAMDLLMSPTTPSPRRGSLNDITKINKAMDLLLSPSPPSSRRGSLGDIPALPPAPNSPLLQQRRNTIPVSPLCDKPLSPVTKNLVHRELVRRSSSVEESPPDLPKPTTLEEQFKQLESCRYIRKRGSQEVEEDVRGVFVTKIDIPQT